MTVNQDAPIASLDATIPAGTVAGLAEGPHVVLDPRAGRPGQLGRRDLGDPGRRHDRPGHLGHAGPADAEQRHPAVQLDGTRRCGSRRPTMSDPVSEQRQQHDRQGRDVHRHRRRQRHRHPAHRQRRACSTTPPRVATRTSRWPPSRRSPNGHAHGVRARAGTRPGTGARRTRATLLVDKTAPALSGVSLTPNPTQGASTPTLAATVTDAWTAPVAAEWFLGTDPGAGQRHRRRPV